MCTVSRVGESRSESHTRRDLPRSRNSRSKRTGAEAYPWSRKPTAGGGPPRGAACVARAGSVEGGGGIPQSTASRCLAKTNWSRSRVQAVRARVRWTQRTSGFTSPRAEGR